MLDPQEKNLSLNSREKSIKAIKQAGGYEPENTELSVLLQPFLFFSQNKVMAISKDLLKLGILLPTAGNGSDETGSLETLIEEASGNDDTTPKQTSVSDEILSDQTNGTDNIPSEETRGNDETTPKQTVALSGQQTLVGLHARSF